MESNFSQRELINVRSREAENEEEKFMEENNNNRMYALENNENLHESIA